jgi:gliding motility-associated-like protein
MLRSNKFKWLRLFTFCIFVSCKAWSQGCVDTIISKQFDIENFAGTFWGSTNYQDSLGNLYLLGSRYIPTSPTQPILLRNNLVKFDRNKKITWSKYYQGSLGFDDFSVTRRIIGQDKDHNLYFAAWINIGGIGSVNNYSLLKLDSSGNILANKLLARQTLTPAGYGFLVFNNPTKIFSTLIASYILPASADPTLVAVDKDLTAIRWNKSYRPGINFIGSSTIASVESDDTTSITVNVVSYKNPLNTADTLYTFNFVKVHSLTGNIIAQRSYSCFDVQNPGKNVRVFPSPVNINYTAKEFIYSFRTLSNNHDTYTFLKMDKDLNIAATASFISNNALATANFNSINNNNIILNTNFTENGITKFATVNWNANLELITQKAYYSGQFTGNSSYVSLTYKNINSTFSYFVANTGFLVQGNNPVYLFDNIKNPNFEFDCSDKDIDLFSPVTLYGFNAGPVSFTEQPGLNYQLIDNINNYTALNGSFTESKYCDIISNCNSLKISGKSSFCLNKSNIDSFKVNRNSACLRKTKWSVNTTQMQVLQSNDSMVKVKFLQPFKGYIKAAYENCNIIDSFYIAVDTMYNVKTGVYLGNDTIQCVGKSIVLNAGDGFKEYSWQDGSALNTFTTSNTGLFYVAAKDSCNNIFRDSVYIQPNPKRLDLVQTGILCEYDTAKIILPNQLTNYLWQPTLNSLTRNNILLLFPAGNTIYTVSGESHNNCRVTDTLLIKKNNCYGVLYFPTAFSPDNNGINDIYKPRTTGILDVYQITIFNRYGETVFSTNNIAVGWDGKYKGKLLAGAYTWICNYTFRNGKQEKETGSFILIK